MILRPQFIALYFDQPDHSGHAFGPDSVEVCTYVCTYVYEISSIYVIWNAVT